MRLRAAPVAASLALLTASCGAPLMKLPKLPGPAAPASDARDALADATKACRAVSSFTAETAASGSVAGRRLRARLLVGLAAPASARIEAAAPFGEPLFFFVSRGGDATLLLPRDRRVLEHGTPRDVLEAVTGIPLSAADLRSTLTGCASADPARGQRAGDDWRIVPDGENELYLNRKPPAAEWRLVAVVHRDPSSEWRAEYRDFQNGMPRTIRLVSRDARRFDLRLELSQVETNVPLGAEAFRVRVPAGTEPITLEDLRQNGPLGRSGANGR